MQSGQLVVPKIDYSKDCSNYPAVSFKPFVPNPTTVCTVESFTKGSDGRMLLRVKETKVFWLLDEVYFAPEYWDVLQEDITTADIQEIVDDAILQLI